MALTTDQLRVVEELKGNLRRSFEALAGLPESYAQKRALKDLNMALVWVDEILIAARAESED